MNRLYRYSGTVSSFEYRRNNPNALPFSDLILANDDYSIAPVRIEALGGLADYILAIENTDAEERYLTADWYYDRNLMLVRIEIPSTEPNRPAKIIAQADSISPEAFVFGPAEYIETRAPAPMSRDERSRWLEFKAR